MNDSATQSASTVRPVLSGMSPDDIADAFSLKPFQGRQIFSWIHQKHCGDPNEMTNLSKDLRATLADKATVFELEPVRSSDSKSGTRKALLRLRDGETVESVLIPDGDRVTLCLSSQVGCPLKCSFCATGMSGFARNLSASEIVEQALVLVRDGGLGDRKPNIVYMGMGEPFRNYDAVVKSIRLLTDENGLGLGARRITVSTAGEVEGIRRFAQEAWQVRLSVSLHAANDALRDELVPLNKRYPIATLMEAIDEYTSVTGRLMTFEWTLLAGVNDRPSDAEELAALTQGRNIHVNLIPFNPVHGTGYRPPKSKDAKAFRNRLAGLGVKTTLRAERGGDIDAACGQLRRRTVEA